MEIETYIVIIVTSILIFGAYLGFKSEYYTPFC